MVAQWVLKVELLFVPLVIGCDLCLNITGFPSCFEWTQLKVYWINSHKNLPVTKSQLSINICIKTEFFLALICEDTSELPFTFFTSWYIATPCEIPLTHEDLGAAQLISGVALVGDHGAVDQVGVGGALPAVGDLGQLGASVVPWHLFRRWNGWREKREWWLHIKQRISILRHIHVNNCEFSSFFMQSRWNMMSLLVDVLCNGLLSRERLQLQTRLFCAAYIQVFWVKNVNTGLWCWLVAAQHEPSLTAARVKESAKQWVKSAEAFPGKCTSLLCFSVCCYHIHSAPGIRHNGNGGAARERRHRTKTDFYLFFH